MSKCVICEGKSRRIKLPDGRSFPSPACRNCARKFDSLERIRRGRNIRPVRNRVRFYRTCWRKSKWYKGLANYERKQQTERKPRLAEYEISDAVAVRYGQQHVNDPQYRDMIEKDAADGLGIWMDTDKLKVKHIREALARQKVWQQELGKLEFEYQRRRIAKIVANNPGIGAKRVMKLIKDEETGIAPVSKSFVDRLLRELKAA